MIAKMFCLISMCLVMAACDRAEAPGCMWNWSTRPLSDLSGQVQGAVEAAGLSGATASAVAFGEDCIDPKSGEVKRFATMQTDFRITVPVGDVRNLDELGDLAEQVLEVLDSFPAKNTPGPQSGDVSISFEAGEERLHLWFSIMQADKAREQGLHGAALLEALRQ
ncbi:MAG: hypothetical protein JSW37_09900 [Anaerolineales bacterium]|nr:MAG: hypothetical protein JSW37_09900 [Anaerolineales bacterium]